MNRHLLISFILIGIGAIISAVLLPYLPDTMVSHWGINGEPNGYMPKVFALSFVPTLMLLMAGLFELFSHIDPLKKNIDTFRKEFDMFSTLLILFLLYIHILTLVWNMGIPFNLGQWMFPALGGLFWNIGSLLSKTKRNFFVGIRTPWTLSSDTVWDKTHALGAKLFKTSGILTVLSVCVPSWGFFILLGTIIGSAVATTVYSYIVFKKETNTQQ
ncbi:MAG: SdpI family protein [Candidatus Yonathbacteria bacterium]|nr:SdpI family protein [Candidatus Yonathbacteria bacterium]